MFTRRMYDKLKILDAQGRPLKQHHHISVDQSFKKDCRIWQVFLKNADIFQMCRPFVDVKGKTYAKVLNFYSDAWLNVTFGMGAIFCNQFIVGRWGKQFIQQESPSIEFLELFALFAALKTWGHSMDLRNTRIVIFCDNQSVKNMVNNLVSHCPQCMKLLHMITLDGIKYNRRVVVEYVRSKDNGLSNALSRMNFREFWRLAPATMQPLPLQIPQDIWPVTKIWFDDKL